MVVAERFRSWKVLQKVRVKKQSITQVFPGKSTLLGWMCISAHLHLIIYLEVICFETDMSIWVIWSTLVEEKNGGTHYIQIGGTILIGMWRSSTCWNFEKFLLLCQEDVKFVIVTIFEILHNWSCDNEIGNIWI